MKEKRSDAQPDNDAQAPTAEEILEEREAKAEQEKTDQEQREERHRLGVS